MNLCGRKGMQQGFDRRIGRRRIQQIDALEVDHVLVGELVELAQPAQFGETDGGETRWLDIAHVPAGSP